MIPEVKESRRRDDHVYAVCTMQAQVARLGGFVETRGTAESRSPDRPRGGGADARIDNDGLQANQAGRASGGSRRPLVSHP